MSDPKLEYDNAPSRRALVGIIAVGASGLVPTALLIAAAVIR